MALNNREMCKVGDSPSRDLKSEIIQLGLPGNGENLECEPSTSGTKSEQDSPKSPLMSPRRVLSPSTSPSTPPEKSDRRQMSTRLMMQKNESVISKGSKSPKHAAWKTSKFFSRSMASGELLKGFKKLSTNSSPSVNTTDEDPTLGKDLNDPNKISDQRNFKNRFSSLRRKSGSDTDKVPMVDEETLKHGSSDIKGIVCKKEDIISLINVHTKERRVSSPGDLNIHSCLPTTAVPVLKSPSLKVPPGSPLNRGNFRSSRSSSLDPTMVPNERLGFRSPHKPPIRTVLHPPPVTCHRISDDIYIQKKSYLDVMPDTKRRLSGPLIEIKENKILETNGGNEASGSSNEDPVQWDEGNFVDPNLLGGAIEAFLKGMGSTGPSSGEKRVSFKKN